MDNVEQKSAADQFAKDWAGRGDEKAGYTEFLESTAENCIWGGYSGAVHLI